MREMKGNLSLLGLGTLLQHAVQQGTRGILKVSRDKEVKTLFIDGGDVRLVTATERRATLLGQILIREGIVTLQDVEEALVKATPGGQRLGQLLLDRGKITPEALQGALRRQAMEEFLDLFTWEEAWFEFREERPAPQDQMPPISIMELVLEAVRRTDEFRKIHQIIPSAHLILKRMVPALPQDDPALDPMVVRSLGAYLDDRRSVADVVKLSPFPRFEVERTLAGLILKGAVKLIDPRGPSSVKVTLEAPAPAKAWYVCVMSDFPAFAEMLAAGLTRGGITATAIDPETDSLSFGFARPDAILLDLLDSTQGVERIRRLGRDVGAPIVVLSSNPTPEAALQLVNAGAREVLIKPVTAEVVAPKLRRIFGAAT
jgi:CheY-like chemotaxis protein